MSSSKKRVSSSQQKTIISYLEENERFKTRKLSAGFTIENYEKMWDALTELLNADGTGPSKSTDKWKKVLADWKSNCKAKAARIKKSLNATGGGEKSTEVLTPLEEQLLAVYGKEMVEGIASAQEYGLLDDSETTSTVEMTSDHSDERQARALKENFFNVGYQNRSTLPTENTPLKPTSSVSKKPLPSTSSSSVYAGLENYIIDDFDSASEEPIVANENKRHIEKSAKISIEKRQKLMTEGKKAKQSEFENTSSLLEKLQDSQNDVLKDIATSLSRHAKATEDLVLQQKQLVEIKKEKNLIEKLKLATHKRTNDVIQMLVDAIAKKDT